MTTTFNSITLSNPSPLSQIHQVRTTEHVLLNGKTVVQGVANYGTKFRFRCMTTSFAEITSHLGNVGSPYTLAVEGTNYTNCYITAFSITEATPTSWQYDVEFTRDTGS
jgi:hypothetical protein